MQAERIQEIPLDAIAPHPGNRLVGGFDQAKLEQLADSIRAVGVQQPAVVRAWGDKDHFQLVAGERRWRASRIAGLQTLPCVVRDLDDVTVLKIQTIENLQREDVHPLDEADGFQRLIEVAQYDVETIASELGKSPSYVYQRIKLRELIPAARKMLEAGTITAGHAIQVARLQPAQQKEVMEFWKYIKEGDDPIGVRELAARIEQEILLDLSAAGFKKDDADLVPKAGACTACQKRTGYQPALFEDIGAKDRCLDGECYNAKLDALVARKLEALDGEDHLEVRGSWDRRGDVAPPAGSLQSWEWVKCKKKDPGAVVAIYVTGTERGTTTWGYKIARSGKAERSQKDPELVRQEKERKDVAKQATEERRALYDDVMEHLGDGLKQPTIEVEIARIVALALTRVGYDLSREICALESWEVQDDDHLSAVAYHVKEMNITQIWRLLVQCLVVGELKVHQYGTRPPRALYTVADVLGVPHPEVPEEPDDDEYDDDGQVEDDPGIMVEDEVPTS